MAPFDPLRLGLKWDSGVSMGGRQVWPNWQKLEVAPEVNTECHEVHAPSPRQRLLWLLPVDRHLSPRGPMMIGAGFDTGLEKGLCLGIHRPLPAFH